MHYNDTQKDKAGKIRSISLMNQKGNIDHRDDRDGDQNVIDEISGQVGFDIILVDQKDNKAEDSPHKSTYRSLPCFCHHVFSVRLDTLKGSQLGIKDDPVFSEPIVK